MADNATGQSNEELGWSISPKDQLSYDCIDDPEPYWPHELCVRKPGVPEGRMVRGCQKDCAAWPGVPHDWAVYVPAACDGTTPANLMVLLDGHMYERDCHIPEVVDNLIAEGVTQPTVCVFHEPGQEGGPGLPVYGGTDNRSVEYDSIDDTFVTYLVSELLPIAEEIHPITDDPDRRAIVGISSGGNAAFAAAWNRPDVFRKVVGHSASFAAIRGGHELPYKVRLEERKSLRVWLSAGEKDLDIVFGDWLLANRVMAAALEYRDYDYQFHVTVGAHNLRYASATMPETLRWLWR